MSSQIIPLKARTDFRESGRILATETVRGCRVSCRRFCRMNCQIFSRRSQRLTDARASCRTEFSNPSTTSSITIAVPGTGSSIGYGKIMSLARRDWVAERQEGEAHRPVLANPEAAAPRTLEWGGGRSKKFKTVGAQGAAAGWFCYICKKSLFF